MDNATDVEKGLECLVKKWVCFRGDSSILSRVVLSSQWLVTSEVGQITICVKFCPSVTQCSVSATNSVTELVSNTSYFSFSRLSLT